MRSFQVFKIILIFVVLPFTGNTQNIILNRGFQELKLGLNENQVDEIVGFHGKSITANDYKTQFSNDKDAMALLGFLADFDQCIIYKHIMPIPVSKLFLKKGKVTAIEINSYPEFTRPICLDSQTKEGLRFWDRSEDLEKLYGFPDKILESGEKNIYKIYKKHGMAFGMSNDEVRIIYFYR